MAVIKRKNFSRNKLSNLICENGDRFEECNFTQLTPTEICIGKTGLEFYACNLINCILPIGAVKERCLHIQKSFCTNLHPDMTDLTPCTENCDHVIDSDSITIDGVLIDTIYHYEDTNLGGIV